MTERGQSVRESISHPLPVRLINVSNSSSMVTRVWNHLHPVPVIIIISLSVPIHRRPSDNEKALRRRKITFQQKEEKMKALLFLLLLLLVSPPIPHNLVDGWPVRTHTKYLNFNPRQGLFTYFIRARYRVGAFPFPSFFFSVAANNFTKSRTRLFSLSVSSGVLLVIVVWISTTVVTSSSFPSSWKAPTMIVISTMVLFYFWSAMKWLLDSAVPVHDSCTARATDATRIQEYVDDYSWRIVVLNIWSLRSFGQNVSHEKEEILKLVSLPASTLHTLLRVFRIKGSIAWLVGWLAADCIFLPVQGNKTIIWLLLFSWRGVYFWKRQATYFIFILEWFILE